MLRKIIMSFLISIIFVVIGYLIAFPISSYYHTSFKDVMFLEGLITTVIASLFSIAGNASDLTFQGFRDKTWQNIEYKKLMNQPVEKFRLNVLNIIFGGILIMLFSIFLV